MVLKILCDKCDNEFERSEMTQSTVTGGTMWICKECNDNNNKIKKEGKEKK
jgi:hypothetical protein